MIRKYVYKFVIGEFGICEPIKFVYPFQCQNQTGFTDAGVRYNRLVGWLKKFKEEGIRQIRIWQLGKDECGHVDCCSFEYLPLVQGHNEPFLDWLKNDGWL